ncbi:MAG: hypothetical protein ACREA2_15315 [Blastocatellia bacterium]
MAVVKRVRVLSVGKVMGVLYALIGLIAGALFSLASLAGSVLGAAGGQENPFAILFGLGSVVFFPVFYGIFGFIGGIIMAALYNLVASIIGGIEVELVSG